jgi:hypothetical protein
MKFPALLLAAAAMTIASFEDAAAQQVYAYPAKGQSPEQQTKDQGECHSWAVQQTGYNPYQSSGGQQTGGVVRGAAGGAAIGAVGGAIAGDAGKGAAIGAASGALFGGVRQNRQNRQQSNQAAQAGNAYAQAYGACMSSRGYTVN